jgi:hypothetical protein
MMVLPRNTTQHLPHAHEQLLVGWMGVDDNNNNNNNNVNLRGGEGNKTAGMHHPPSASRATACVVDHG